MKSLRRRLNLTHLKIAYYGIPHKHLTNPLRQFFKRLRGFLWRKGVTYYHPEKQHINTVVNDDLQTQALLNFDAHKEQSDPAWWLRVLSKKE